MVDYSGYWTGQIEGTNQAGFTIDIKQEGDAITGIATIYEPKIGQYEYSVNGTAGVNFSANLVPGRSTSGISLGKTVVVGSLDASGVLVGRWKSEIGTEGVFSAKRFEEAKLTSQLPSVNSVFLVHGHEEGSKHAVARFLEQIGIVPVILHEQINRGMTVIEKFEDFASRAGFAIILMTPDDVGYPVGAEEQKKFRARQNVVLELGYFFAKLGRPKMIVLTKGEIEFPSDVFGIVHEPIDKGEGWKIKIAKELKASGFDVDMNKAI